MLQSLLEQRRPLSVFATERSLPAALTANQWELMKKTADVLLTRLVSREDTTAADVIPAITGHLYLYFLFYIVTFIDIV